MKKEIIYPELSYAVMGAVFEVHNTFSYLKATHLRLGILINFSAPSVEYERIAN